MKGLDARIEELKCRRNAVILAHNYQRPEIQEIADWTGDSLALSRKAAGTKAEVVVFCGVRFMAETAAVISPDKIVLLPDADAGCPLADTVNTERLRAKINECPEDTAVVCYVNSPVEVKAESDVCCTSSNAVDIVNSLENRNILFLPDKNLGNFVSSKTEKNIILWDGFCPCHMKPSAEDISKLNRKDPEAVVFAHPECREEVIRMADEVLSTGGMLQRAAGTKAGKIIIATEEGILYPLRKANPGKEFYPANDNLYCRDMKLITLEKVLKSLMEMKHRILIPEHIADRARKSIDRMLGVSS